MKLHRLLYLLVALILGSACTSIPVIASTTIITSEDSPVGTWTPSVGGTATYTLQTGTYTKVGKMVTVFCRMSIAVLGTGSATTISGFPYPIDLDPYAYAVAPVYVNYLAASVVNVVGLVGVGGVNSMALYSLTSAGTQMGLNSIIGDGSDIYFSVSYLTP